MGNINLKIIDVVLAFSEAFDLIDKKVNNHHYDVAYLTFEFSKKLNLKGEKLNRLIMASLLHDIGCFKDSHKIKLLDFEFKYANEHSINGYNLLKEVDLLSPSAEYIKYHHCAWEDFQEKDDLALLSNIIYITDRIAILFNKKAPINQLSSIEKRLEKERDRKFSGELIDAFKELKNNEEIWRNFAYDDLEGILKNELPKNFKQLNYEEILELAEFYARLIDLKSRFTAVHSIGVSATAEKLGELLKINLNDRKKLKLAGYFHDIGKLAIPNKIIDKKGKLSEEEFGLMKKHPYHTYRLVNKLNGFSEIASIAAQHHESLSGNGYPLGLTSHCLSYNSRILAVADVFTALTEDRPYRTYLNKNEVTTILKEMVKERKLDEKIVSVAIKEYDGLRKINLSNQRFISDTLILTDSLAGVII